MAKWQPRDYTPFFLWDEPTHTEKEIRAEYSRMRSIIRKRANRLREAGFETRADYIMSQIPLIGEIKSHKDVTNYLSQAHSIWESDSFSIAGMKRIQQEIFEETGIRIPLSDILEFDDYMKSWRTSKYRWLISTQYVASLYFKEYQEIGGDFVNFYEIFLARQQYKK